MMIVLPLVLNSRVLLPMRALRPRDVGGDFDFDLGPEIDEPVDIKQRRRRKTAAERFLPGRANAGAGRLIFAAAGEIPGQAHDVFRAGAGLSQQLDDPFQGRPNLGGHVRMIIPLLVAAGLAGQHDPSSGAIDFDAVGKPAGFRPISRLQDTHGQVLLRWPILSTEPARPPTAKLWTRSIAASADLRVANRRALADTGLPASAL